MTHVVALVDDLLDVSRITRGTIDLTLERVNLSDVVMKAVEQAAPAIESRRHQLRIDVADSCTWTETAGACRRSSPTS